MSLPVVTRGVPPSRFLTAAERQYRRLRRAARAQIIEDRLARYGVVSRRVWAADIDRLLRRNWYRLPDAVLECFWRDLDRRGAAVWPSCGAAR